MARSGRSGARLGVALLALALGGCTDDDATALSHLRLKLAGSTTLEPVARDAADAFLRRHPGARIDVRGGGSTIGVKGVIYGALHLGMVSRPLKPAELEREPRLTVTRVARDGVAVVVRRDLYDAGVRSLTLEQVAAIWRGQLTSWAQVGGPDLPMWPYDLELGRGTRDTFGLLVLGKEDAPAPAAKGVLGGNESIVEAITNQPGAVSPLSTGWQSDLVMGVAIAPAQGRTPIAPTSEEVAAGRYPITRDLSLVTLGQPEGLAAEFVQFLRSPEGQAIAARHGYTPAGQ